MAEQIIRALCAARGIRIERRGLAYALIGPGVSILCASLAMLELRDLRPAHAVSPEARSNSSAGGSQERGRLFL